MASLRPQVPQVARPCSSALPSRTAPVPGWRACGRIFEPMRCLVGQVGVPVGEPGVVTGNEDLPLVAGQLAAPCAQRAVRAEAAFVAGAAVDVGASVGRVGQRGVHGMVSGLDPGDLAGLAVQVDGLLQRPAQALAAQPQPGSAHRPAHRELPEHRRDDAGDRLVGAEADLPVALAPDQADRQPAAQLAAGGLVLDAALQPGPQHMQLRFGHDAHQPQHEPVGEQRRMVDAVGVGDQRVAHPGQVKKPVPRRVIARQPGGLQRQDDPDLAEGHLGDHALEPGPLPGHRPRDAQVAVDDPDRLPRPAQLPGPVDQVVLAGGGLGIAFELGQGGLPDVDQGRSGEVGAGYLAGLTHRRPPLPRRPRLPSRSGGPAAPMPLPPARREDALSGPGVAPEPGPAAD